MFDQMLESRRAGIAVQSPRSVPIAVLLHVGLLVAGVAASYLVIQEVEPFDGGVIIVVPPMPPAEPPPPPPAADAPAARSQSAEPPELELPREPLQPQDVPHAVIEDVLDMGRPADSIGDTAGTGRGPESRGGVGESIGSDDGVPGGTGPASGPRIPGHEGVTNPELILESKVQPDYPEMARQVRTSGRVILQAVIQPDGSVGEIQVLRCTRPNLGFEEAAIQAVQQWRYKPATQYGVPVAVYFTVVVEFQLN